MVEDSINKCEWCEKLFSTKYNLKNHNETAKYCLKLRGVQGGVIKCAACEKQFTRKSTLKTHKKTCLDFIRNNHAKEMEQLEAQYKKVVAREKVKDRLLREKDMEIAVLLKDTEIAVLVKEKDVYKEVYKDAANKPTNITNNINPKLLKISIDNIRPLTIETVREDVHKYTYTDFLIGTSGLKKFIEGIIADDEERNYVCTDPSRNKFHRLVESREWKTDDGAHFINAILDELKEVATEHFQTLVDAEKDAVTDVFRREEIEQLRVLAKPVYYGITSSDHASADRERLFKSVRNRIRDVAAV